MPEITKEQLEFTASETTVIPELLADLGSLAAADSLTGEASSAPEMEFENQLAMVRLGIATALYYALRTKHPPTAAHSLRVAVGCSAWAEWMGVEPEVRDRIEVAALLHDIGKIGIPDSVLRKPGKLSVREQLAMDLYPRLGCEILEGCTDDAEILGIVRYGHTWYDSRRSDDGPQRDELPLGARMLSIVGAFDSMTTDHVYRPAISRERALTELLEGSGTQFDGELVHDYCRMLESHPAKLQGQVMTRWLRQLKDKRDARPWSTAGRASSVSLAGDGAESQYQMFHRQLFDHMHDGVVFIDKEGNVVEWNRALERMSGVGAEAAINLLWTPDLVGLCDSQNQPVMETQCPLLQSLKSGMYSSRQMLMRGADGTEIPVHIHVSAVTSGVSETYGAMAVFHDASRQANLEERLVDLHEQATKDSLTRVDNRGQFDRALIELTDLATNSGATFSLIICDIDHFKRINDMHGHQAGDEALVCFADVLKACTMEGDLVCRYGGEEFVVLSPGSDNPAATQRAEQIRAAIESTLIDSLNRKNMTASFGVTEYQAGDSPETLLARADRALLKAKDGGRNQVVQLGAGRSSDPETASGKTGRLSSWLSWFEGGDVGNTEVRMITPVPADLAIEKLRGFIADHQATIQDVTESKVSIRMSVMFSFGGRRRVDQRIDFDLTVQLSEEHTKRSASGGMQTSTVIDAQLRPVRGRDRRMRELTACTDRVIASLRSYLMATLVRP